MSSRGASPTPLNRGSGEATHRRQGSFDSYYSNKGKDSPPPANSSRFDDYRKALGGHHTPTRKSSGPPPGPKPSSPTVNVYTHCGRHSDQFLFNGWGDIVRSTFHKKE
ncbi:hypothetical protein AAE478_003853 [Parahypoxylon ruwenzoriense]